MINGSIRASQEQTWLSFQSSTNQGSVPKNWKRAGTTPIKRGGRMRGPRRFLGLPPEPLEGRWSSKEVKVLKPRSGPWTLPLPIINSTRVPPGGTRGFPGPPPSPKPVWRGHGRTSGRGPPRRTSPHLGGYKPRPRLGPAARGIVPLLPTPRRPPAPAAPAPAIPAIPAGAGGARSGPA